MPSSLLTIANADSSGGGGVHPARMPYGLAEFLVRLGSRPGQLVLDPFAGALTTAKAAERNGRRWIAVDVEERWLREGVRCWDRGGPGPARWYSAPGIGALRWLEEGTEEELL